MKSKIKASEEYLSDPYARLLIPDEAGGYTAEILEFPGCVSEGETEKEAMDNLANAALAWIEASQKQGKEIPAPRGDYDYSGRVALRLPASLHRQAALLAARDQTSLNQFFVSSIAASVGALDMYQKVKEQLQRFTMNVHTTFIIEEPRSPVQVANTGTAIGSITIPVSDFATSDRAPSSSSWTTREVKSGAPHGR
jgi:predicted RNase H-like HicB family nuclease